MSCYKYLHWEEKQKYHITSRSSKLSWDHFFWDLCYSDRRIILSYYEKRKVTYYVCRKEGQYIPFNEQQKCHVTNIYTERKNKSIILHSFARKTKVSYYITVFQTLLKTFSTARRNILSYCKKRKINYYVCRQEEQYIPFNKQQKCHVTNIYTVLRGKTRVSYYILLREKQKYHITSRSSKLSWERFSCGLCHAEIATAIWKQSN